ncbi:MAG TPA: hypothetical protein VK819_07005 [Acidobacteriaceae bacterium]|jgi:hypothetical protein|nr:hypothetical protein [Acidobacteriaceae bacterium]
MATPWKVVEATVQGIALVRGDEQQRLDRPSNPAARAMFMQFRPGAMMDDDTIHFILSFDKQK